MLTPSLTSFMLILVEERRCGRETSANLCNFEELRTAALLGLLVEVRH